MTFMKTTFASVAALALAAPAFASDGHQDDKKKAKMKAEATVTVDKDEMDPVKVNDTVGEILQADGEPSIQSDGEIIVMDDTVSEETFRDADDDSMVADNAIVVPGSEGTLSTVTCPPGTEAQVDMTCLITGDYQPDLED